jgi:hypothetical protein
MQIKIAMWSGPRNISTAMMRSFENRSDTEVVDEPFYAYYLKESGSPHPMAAEVLASQSQDYMTVVKQLTEVGGEASIQYQKQMTHHLGADEDLSWTAELINCFLIRDPAEVIASYTQSRGVCSAQDIGIIRQWQIYQQVQALTGQALPIVDANDVLQNPERILTALCAKIGIPFQPKMLSWPPGSRRSDGVWHPHWYASVKASTGFAAYVAKTVSLDTQQREVYAAVKPYYAELYARRIQGA